MHEKSKETQSRPHPGYHFSDFALYPSERQLYQEKRPVPIAPKAFDALVCLVSKAEHLVRKDELMESLWPGVYVSETNLTNVIVGLRKLLGAEAIRTVSKHGYRFELPVKGEPGVRETAYAAFIRAKETMRVPSVASMLRARDLLWLSIAEDPGFAHAWAWLGRCCRFLDKFELKPSCNLDLAKAAFRRAFALDADLASAHHFYTPLEADLGHSHEAMSRLLKRLAKAGPEPEVFAGLVQVLRFGGLLEESLAAHYRAVSLDPAIATSVTHTHFLRGEYEAVIETYGGRGNYLDAAAWAALGDNKRAIELLELRTANSELSPVFAGLMKSLLAILVGDFASAAEEMNQTSVDTEPEVVFYFARQFSKLNDPEQASIWLKRAHSEGFVCARSLRDDPWFAAVRASPEFPGILGDAQNSEDRARRTFERLGAAQNSPKIP